MRMDDGCLNPKADVVPRIKTRWSDTLLNRKTFSEKTFGRLTCVCGSVSFEVLQTGEYETTARCHQCGRYFIVHCG